MALLELKDVCKNFGKLQAVSHLNFAAEKGKIHSLIGPNGAGKSTVFNLITGTLPVTSGKIIFNGEDLTGKPAHKIAQKGLSRSFQQTYLFMYESAVNNLMMGFHMRCHAGVIREFLHTPLARKIDEDCRKKALEILEFMGLTAVKNELPINLPHGDQRALGVSLALACNPTLLMLDEPITGMNPTETMEMVERIRKIRESGVTIILVEHSMRVVMNVSDRITVLNYGRTIAEGLPNEIRNNKEVVEAYLGKEEK